MVLVVRELDPVDDRRDVPDVFEDVRALVVTEVVRGVGTGVWFRLLGLGVLRVEVPEVVRAVFEVDDLGFRGGLDVFRVGLDEVRVEEPVVEERDLRELRLEGLEVRDEVREEVRAPPRSLKTRVDLDLLVDEDLVDELDVELDLVELDLVIELDFL